MADELALTPLDPYQPNAKIIPWQRPLNDWLRMRWRSPTGNEQNLHTRFLSVWTAFPIRVRRTPGRTRSQGGSKRFAMAPPKDGTPARYLMI